MTDSISTSTAPTSTASPTTGTRPETPTGAHPAVPPEASSERGARTATSAGPVSVALAVVSGLALAGIAGSITFGVMWAHDRSQASDQAASRAVAQRFLLDLTNFGPKTLNADFSDMQGLATGRFATQAHQFFDSQIRAQLTAAQAQTQGHINNLYQQSYSGSSASFYADVTQTFRNNRSPAVRSDDLRVVVDLSKVDGQWKVAQVTTLNAASGVPGAAPGR